MITPNSGNIKRELTKQIFEIIKNNNQLGQKLMAVVLAEVHSEVRKVIIENISSGSLSITWDELSDEIGIVNSSEKDKMIAILENETISRMAENCYLSYTLFTDKSKHGIAEESLNPKRWVYLAD